MRLAQHPGNKRMTLVLATETRSCAYLAADRLVNYKIGDKWSSGEADKLFANGRTAAATYGGSANLKVPDEIRKCINDNPGIWDTPVEVAQWVSRHFAVEAKVNFGALVVGILNNAPVIYRVSADSSDGLLTVRQLVGELGVPPPIWTGGRLDVEVSPSLYLGSTDWPSVRTELESILRKETEQRVREVGPPYDIVRITADGINGCRQQ